MSLNSTSLITTRANRKSYRFDIPNSLRFRNDQYSRLTKIFSTAQTDTTKWTVSFWYKNADNDDMSDVYFFQSNSGTDSGFHYNEIGVSYGPNNVGIWNQYNVTNPWSLSNGNEFRDTNWYHFVYSYDESETNAIDRLKQYINGVRSTVTASLGSGPSSSYQCDWCKQNYYTAIGRAYDGLQHPSHSAYPFRGYMAEFHSFDGIVLEPSDFGRTDKYGNWVPKKVTNTNYGNNGFYLDFSDRTDIGADRSGNNNHFTPSGFDTSQIEFFSDDLTPSTSSWGNGTGPHKMFDGDYATYAQPTGTPNAEMTFTPKTPIPFTSSLKFYNYGVGYYSLNGGADVAEDTATQGTWATVSTGSGTLTSLKFGPANIPAVGAIEVDGVILKDNFDNDYSLDSPTNNYATWDTLTPHVTTSHGDLNITNQRNCTTTFGKFKTGKYYFEWNATQAGYIGVTDNINSWGNNTTPFAESDDSLGYYAANQRLYRNSSTGVVYGPIIQFGILAMAVDFDNGTIEYFHNGSSLGSATDATSALTPGKEYYIAGQGLDTTNDLKTNFGQQPFIYTPPTGYYPLAIKYLPAQKFIDGEDHFKTIVSDATSSFVSSGAVTDVTNNGGKNWSFDNTFYLYYGSVSPDSSAHIYNPNDTADAIMLNFANTFNGPSGGASSYYGFFAPGGLFDTTLTFDPALPNASVLFSGGCGDGVCTSLNHGSSCGDARPEVNNSVYDLGHVGLIRVPSSGTQSIDRIKIRSFCEYVSCYACAFSSAGSLESNGSRKVFVDNQVVLEFANASDVSGFTAGDIVYKRGDSTVRGEVESINSASAPYTITVRTNDTWSNGDILETDNILNEARTIFPSGLWWIKDRVNSNQHQLVDVMNGDNDVWQTPAATGGHNYSLPTGNSVAWCWRAGDTTVANTNGTINSNVRANPDAGFSIVQWTGTETAGSVGHGLNSTPDFIIATGYTGSLIPVWHSSPTPAAGYNYLNNTGGWLTNVDIWNSAQMSATTFGVSTNPITNDSGELMTAYVWHSVPGYSAFGSYTGNSSTDGRVVVTGFKPSFILIKSTSGYNWTIVDSTRNPHNPVDTYLFPNEQLSDGTYSTYDLDFLSNGFKLRSSTATDTNYNTNTYIYAAFAEKPSFAKNFSSANPR